MQDAGENLEVTSNKQVNSRSPINPSVQQEEIHDLLFSREIGWQEIIYDLINTEQLNPWDINLTTLTEKYLIKIQEIEEADFFVSSKVLLAAALLLRIKSEILLNKYIKSIDEILFGKKKEKKYELERIELDEEIPKLVPRSPIPRFKKVTLNELIEALNKAITTENRRIKKEIVNRNALRELNISMPKRTVSIRHKIKELHHQLMDHFEENKEKRKVSFDSFIGMDKEERIIAFSSLLHLENQNKIWLEQQNHFDEIHIWLKPTYLKHNPDPIELLRVELEEIMKIELVREERRNKRREIREEEKLTGKGRKDSKNNKNQHTTKDNLSDEDAEEDAWENAEVGEEFQVEEGVEGAREEAEEAEAEAEETTEEGNEQS